MAASRKGTAIKLLTLALRIRKVSDHVSAGDRLHWTRFSVVFLNPKKLFTFVVVIVTAFHVLVGPKLF